MSVIRINPCQHKSIEFDRINSVFRCKECGIKLDIKEIAELLNKLPENTTFRQKPASVSCYSPVQAPSYNYYNNKSNFYDYNKKSSFSIIIGRLIILGIIGLIIFLIIIFIL